MSRRVAVRGRRLWRLGVVVRLAHARRRQDGRVRLRPGDGHRRTRYRLRKITTQSLLSIS